MKANNIMDRRYFQAGCLVLVAFGLTLITFLYASQPRSLAEVGTKGAVATGLYQIDEAEFAAGLGAFRRDEFAAARAAFERADPERRHGETQFYVAYSFYRQGWGRISNDDALFTQGLEAVNRVIALDPRYRSADENLQLKTPDELKNELEEGLKLTLNDFDPRRLTRERK